MNTKSRSKKSICERSMKLMTNLVKVSYISISHVGLRTGAPPQPPSSTHNPTSSLSRYPRNLRSQEPINSKKPVSYLIHPGDATRSSLSMIKDEESTVDKDAWDFIRKVHEKNLKDASEISNSEFILPPPPHIMLQSSATNY